MKLVPLKEVCSFRHGGTPSKACAKFWQGDIPWVSPKDMKSSLIVDASDHISEEAVSESATSIVPEGAILVVVRSGILAHSLPIARVGRPVAFNQDIKAIVPSSELASADFLYWFLRAQASQVIARGVKKGATVHSVQSGFIESLLVPLPSMDEQRRVIDVLSRAEGIVRLRRESQKKAAELIPAIFIEMFGDPATNPKDLAMKRVREFVQRFEGGKNLQAGDAKDQPYRMLKVSAVTAGAYCESESKPAPAGYCPPVHHFVRKGDLLFSRANTVGLVGATALVDETNGNTLLPDKLWRLVLRPSVVEAPYVNSLLQMLSVRRALGTLSSGTSDSMRNISQAKLLELVLPIASIEDQRRFVGKRDAVESILRQQSASLHKATATFDSLLAQAFDPAAPL